MGGWWYLHLHAELRALRPMEEEEEVTYSYLSQLHASRQERRALLRQLFSFGCRCPRCEEEKEEEGEGKEKMCGFVCPTCGGPVRAAKKKKEEEEEEEEEVTCLNTETCKTALPRAR